MGSQANSIKWKQLDEYIRSLVSQASVTANSAEIASQIASQLSAYLRKAGGTMTGHIVLAGDPTADLHPVTRQFLFANLSAGGAQTYVDSDTVTGSAVTGFGLSSLTLSDDTWYSMDLFLNSAVAGGPHNVGIYFNGDYTDANYNRELVSQYGRNVNAAPWFGLTRKAGPLIFHFKIFKMSGGPTLVRCWGGGVVLASSGGQMTVQDSTVGWRETDSLTQVEIISATSLNIGVGSSLILYEQAMS